MPGWDRPTACLIAPRASSRRLEVEVSTWPRLGAEILRVPRTSRVLGATDPGRLRLDSPSLNSRSPAVAHASGSRPAAPASSMVVTIAFSGAPSQTHTRATTRKIGSLHDGERRPARNVPARRRNGIHVQRLGDLPGAAARIVLARSRGDRSLRDRLEIAGRSTDRPHESVYADSPLATRMRMISGGAGAASLSARFPAAESGAAHGNSPIGPSPLQLVSSSVRPRRRAMAHQLDQRPRSRTRAGVMAEAGSSRDEHAVIVSRRDPGVPVSADGDRHVEHVTVALVGGWVGDPAVHDVTTDATRPLRASSATESSRSANAGRRRLVGRCRAPTRDRAASPVELVAELFVDQAGREV